jgi:hypothetical protein
MGVLTDFVVAKAEEAEAVGQSSCPYRDFPGIDAKGIDEQMLSVLFAILSGESHPDFMADTLRYQRTDHGPWVFEVPPALVRLLAALGPKEIGDVAVRWIQAEEFAYDPWPPDAVRQCLEDLVALSRRATAEGKVLFMWVCL